MKRAMCFIFCLSLILACGNLHAQTKKKGKEPELAISKRGKLIFEDDFSGNDLVWVFNPNKCEWKIAKKTLLTTSVDREDAYPTVTRLFTATRNVIVQCRAMIPCNASLQIGFGASSRALPCAMIYPTMRTINICFFEKGAGRTDLALGAFPYKKPMWFDVIFEMVEDNCSLSVGGKTIKCKSEGPEVPLKSTLLIEVSRKTPEILAIDDVKVYEALPKDEDEKDKKKK